ncbi:minor tail protein [Microbacterium phage Moleficent]|uniref:Minor tail protein n=5 Tax=Akonivirus phedro TaxID=2845594 RepID=A0A6M3T686_9CAUD|nr:minor tail protein [Microbacterium phage Phedro]QFG04959.1 minor tail protein [Microbacterium phage PhriedRice]QJD52888.1 minor tail protein [Microbacterium phage Phractured]QJD52998.1 minor tail protein [Microbacterium phage Pharky]QNL30339.1 minor tail protein [Microbacterium phage Mazun]QWY82728.1 minor tail protein [Microbacterium phage StagePhright]UXE04125.1 minor tail protein [Microbacterium phage Fullmetal]WNM74540.1 minor tail protein [Microbacterium phage Moleficent]
MASWDHRAGTSNGAYQLYLFVSEITFDNTDRGITYLNWELGIIKVGSSGGFSSTSNNTSWSVSMHGSGGNNGDTSGGASFSFASGDAIGTRRVLATGSNWSFIHNADYTGALSVNTYAYVNTNISLGSAQIGWGQVTFTNFYRDSPAPSTPTLVSRDSDTQVTVKGYNSNDWGLGYTAPAHVLARSDVSNMSSGRVDTVYPTTGAWQGHNVVQSGLTPHKTYYFTSNTRARTGNYAGSGVLTVHARPSKPAPPEVSSKTATTLNLTAAAPSYIGGGLTQRETQISLDNFQTALQTSTHLTAPSFTGLNRVQPYKVRTKVHNGVGWSDWSEIVDVPTPGTPPTAPTGYVVYDIASTSAKVSLGSISDNGGAVPSNVRVKVSTTQSDVGLVKTVTGGSWNPVRLTGLTENTQYYVAEAAYNSVESGGWGAYGAWVPLKTIDTVPNGPVLLLDSAAGNFVTLEWIAPTDLNGAVIANYKLRVGSNEALTANVQEFTVPASTLSQVVTGLTAATNYWAEVWTETDKGRGSGSGLLPFSTTGGGGSSSGLWLSINGTPTFCEVWYSGADGVPKLCEVWHSGADGTPKLCGA